MRKFSVEGLIVLIAVFGFSSVAFAETKVMITSPKNGATVSSPVKVCLAVKGVEVEPAKKGVNEGKGHHHILVDVDLPENLDEPIGKDENHIHMGDGSTCKKVKLGVGQHTIRTLFAKGNHVPYDPVLTDQIQVTVK